MFKMTSGLRKPEVLVRGCLELKETKGLKPQTMPNLSTFLLFVKYCYLAGETNTKTPGLDQKRMMTAIRDARKAFSPAAAEEYRVTSDAMRKLVPPSDVVWQKYQKILKHLSVNLTENNLFYRTPKILNFFLLQGRINTRLIDL